MLERQEVPNFHEAKNYIETINKALKTTPKKAVKESNYKKESVQEIKEIVDALEKQKVKNHFKIERVTRRETYISENLLGSTIPEHPWNIEWFET